MNLIQPTCRGKWNEYESTTPQSHKINKDIFSEYLIQSHAAILDQQRHPKKMCPLEMIDTDIDMPERVHSLPLVQSLEAVMQKEGKEHRTDPQN